MATCEHASSFTAMELPREFQDLEGLLEADIQAMVRVLTERANERLFLTRREHRQLQTTLWNGLTEAINAAVEPLTSEAR